MQPTPFLKAVLALLLVQNSLFAQEISQLTLEQANEWAASNFPLLKKKALAKQSANISNSNLDKNYLPQINVSAQATWQSAVTEVPYKLPGLAIEPLSKDQYKAALDVNQLIYDGGMTRKQKEINELQALLKEEEVNISMQQLKEKVNNVYLNILLLDEQRKQTAIVVSDLEAGLKKVEAQVKNGTSFRSNIALIKAEQLKTQQREIELLNEKMGLLDVLSLYTGKTFSRDLKLTLPAPPMLAQENDISRPELSYYKYQDSLLQQQLFMTDNRLKPKVSAFANGGYGRPGLNMLKNEFAPFVMTGVRMNWNISGWYTSKKEKELTEISRKEVQVQTENFLLNTKSQLKQQNAAIGKLRQLLASDNEIIVLKKEVKEAAKSQLDNGVITANDYIREVNAEDQARQTQLLHQLQLLQALITYSTTAGK